MKRKAQRTLDIPAELLRSPLAATEFPDTDEGRWAAVEQWYDWVLARVHWRRANDVSREDFDEAVRLQGGHVHGRVFR